MSENILDRYAERIKAWRKASAALSYTAIDPKRNAVELYDELAALKRENEALLPFLEKAREAKADGWASPSMKQMVEEYDNAEV